MPFYVVSSQWQRLSELSDSQLLDLTRIVNRGQGFSVSDLDRQLPTTGYFVALAGYERIVRASDFSVTDVERYLDDYKAVLVTNPNRYLGAWVSHDEVYLDVSEWARDLDSAMVLGRQRRQLAIWDIANNDEIEVHMARVARNKPKGDSERAFHSADPDTDPADVARFVQEMVDDAKKAHEAKRK